MTRVKICGLTRVDDALAAVEAGADALGFVFFEKSPRHIKLQAASNICEALPPFVSKVGVFVNELEYTIEKAIGECGLDALQFHGDEPPGFCQKFLPKSIKAFRLRSRGDLAVLSEYDVHAWLLDSFSEKARGGTGEIFDWSLALDAKKLGHPIILSGGLTSENVGEAIGKVRPFAVDVSSGVEISPGIKDHEKMRQFVDAVLNTSL